MVFFIVESKGGILLLFKNVERTDLIRNSPRTQRRPDSQQIETSQLNIAEL